MRSNKVEPEDILASDVESAPAGRRAWRDATAAELRPHEQEAMAQELAAQQGVVTQTFHPGEHVHIACIAELVDVRLGLKQQGMRHGELELVFSLLSAEGTLDMDYTIHTFKDTPTTLQGKPLVVQYIPLQHGVEAWDGVEGWQVDSALAELADVNAGDVGVPGTVPEEPEPVPQPTSLPPMAAGSSGLVLPVRQQMGSFFVPPEA